MKFAYVYLEITNIECLNVSLACGLFEYRTLHIVYDVSGHRKSVPQKFRSSMHLIRHIVAESEQPYPQLNRLHGFELLTLAQLACYASSPTLTGWCRGCADVFDHIKP